MNIGNYPKSSKSNRRDRQEVAGRIPEQDMISLELGPLETRIKANKKSRRLDAIITGKNKAVIGLGKAARSLVNTIDPEKAKPTDSDRINTFAGRRALVGLTIAGLGLAGLMGINQLLEGDSATECVTVTSEMLPGTTPAEDASIYSGYFADLPGNGAYERSMQGFASEGQFSECGDGVNYLPAELVDQARD